MERYRFPNAGIPLPGLAQSNGLTFTKFTEKEFDVNFASAIQEESRKSSLGDLVFLDDSGSLTDNNGALLPAKFDSSLEHLTKTRPRSPSRHSPSRSFLGQRNSLTPESRSADISPVFDVDSDVNRSSPSREVLNLYGTSPPNISRVRSDRSFPSHVLKPFPSLAQNGGIHGTMTTTHDLSYTENGLLDSSKLNEHSTHSNSSNTTPKRSQVPPPIAPKPKRSPDKVLDSNIPRSVSPGDLPPPPTEAPPSLSALDFPDDIDDLPLLPDFPPPALPPEDEKKSIVKHWKEMETAQHECQISPRKVTPPAGTEHLIVKRETTQSSLDKINSSDEKNAGKVANLVRRFSFTMEPDIHMVKKLQDDIPAVAGVINNGLPDHVNGKVVGFNSDSTDKPDCLPPTPPNDEVSVENQPEIRTGTEPLTRSLSTKLKSNSLVPAMRKSITPVLKDKESPSSSSNDLKTSGFKHGINITKRTPDPPGILSLGRQKLGPHPMGPLLPARAQSILGSNVPTVHTLESSTSLRKHTPLSAPFSQGIALPNRGISPRSESPVTRGGFAEARTMLDRSQSLSSPVKDLRIALSGRGDSRSFPSTPTALSPDPNHFSSLEQSLSLSLSDPNGIGSKPSSGRSTPLSRLASLNRTSPNLDRTSSLTSAFSRPVGSSLSRSNSLSSEQGRPSTPRQLGSGSLYAGSRSRYKNSTLTTNPSLRRKFKPVVIPGSKNSASEKGEYEEDLNDSRLNHAQSNNMEKTSNIQQLESEIESQDYSSVFSDEITPEVTPLASSSLISNSNLIPDTDVEDIVKSEDEFSSTLECDLKDEDDNILDRTLDSSIFNDLPVSLTDSFEMKTSTPDLQSESERGAAFSPTLSSPIDSSSPSQVSVRGNEFFFKENECHMEQIVRDSNTNRNGTDTKNEVLPMIDSNLSIVLDSSCTNDALSYNDLSTCEDNLMLSDTKGSESYEKEVSCPVLHPLTSSKQMDVENLGTVLDKESEDEVTANLQMHVDELVMPQMTRDFVNGTSNHLQLNDQDVSTRVHTESLLDLSKKQTVERPGVDLSIEEFKQILNNVDGVASQPGKNSTALLDKVPDRKELFITQPRTCSNAEVQNSSKNYHINSDNCVVSTSSSAYRTEVTSPTYSVLDKKPISAHMVNSLVTSNTRLGYDAMLGAATTQPETEHFIEPPMAFSEGLDPSADIMEEVEFVAPPPPMFASDQVINESEGEGGKRSFKNLPVENWTEVEVGQWLVSIGLPNLKTRFEESFVNGKLLLDIDMPLLEEIGVESVQEREIILSEIYQLYNPDDINFENEIQDALLNASDQEREKFIAVLRALKTPSWGTGVDLRSSLDSDDYMTSDTADSLSLNSGTGGELSSDTLSLSESSGGAKALRPLREQAAKQRIFKHKKKKGEGKEKKEKKKKHGSSFSKFLDLLNPNNRSTSKSVDSKQEITQVLHKVLQTGPQGIIRVYTGILSQKTLYSSFLIGGKTSSGDLLHMVLEKFNMTNEMEKFYLCQVSENGKEVILEENQFPLLVQRKWRGNDKYHFELKSSQNQRGKVSGRIYEVSEEDGLTTTIAEETENEPFKENGVISDDSLLNSPNESLDLNEKNTRMSQRRSQLERLKHSSIDSYDSSHWSGTSLDEHEMGLDLSFDYDRNLKLIHPFSSELNEKIEALEDKEKLIKEKEEEIKKLQDNNQFLVGKVNELEGLQIREMMRNDILTREVENLKAEKKEYITEREKVDEDKDEAKKILETQVKTLSEQIITLRNQDGMLFQNHKDGIIGLEEKEKSIISLKEKIELLHNEMENLKHDKETGYAEKEKEVELLRKWTGDLLVKGKLVDQLKAEVEHLKKKDIEILERDQEIETLQHRVNELLATENLVLKLQGELKRLRTAEKHLLERDKEVELLNQRINYLSLKERELGEVKKEVERLKGKDKELVMKNKQIQNLQEELLIVNEKLKEGDDGDKFKLLKELEDLRLDKIELVDKDSIIEDLKQKNLQLAEHSVEAENLRVKLIEVNERLKEVEIEKSDKEKSSKRQVKILEDMVMHKIQKIQELDNRSKQLEKELRDSQAKEEEQLQNRRYLDTLMGIVRDKDPSLLELLNTKISSSDHDDWC